MQFITQSRIVKCTRLQARLLVILQLLKGDVLDTVSADSSVRETWISVWNSSNCCKMNSVNNELIDQRVRLYEGPDLKPFILLGAGLFRLLLGLSGSTGNSLLLQIFSGAVQLSRCLDQCGSCGQGWDPNYTRFNPTLPRLLIFDRSTVFRTRLRFLVILFNTLHNFQYNVYMFSYFSALFVREHNLYLY